MKRFSIILCLCLGIGMLVSEASASFPDVDESAPYADAVEYLSDTGIMSGDTSGNFNPDKTVTRAQMAAIICRMLGETEALSIDGNRFTDVPESYWANGYIMKAAELGIIGGYQNGSFKPGDTVTYEQALTMVVRAMALEEEATQAGGYPDGYFEIAYEHGYLDQLSAKKGDLMTRWQVAIILYNAYNSIL